MNYRTSFALKRGFFRGGLALAVIGLLSELAGAAPGWILAAAGCVAMVLGAVQALIFCRCPGCGRRLPLFGGRPEKCPGCGKKLDF